MLRDMLRTFGHTRPGYPTFALLLPKHSTERYSSPGRKVLDFSAGYGGRLLGCIAAGCDYVGSPCAQQIEGLERMVAALTQLGLVSSSVQLRQLCAEDAMQKKMMTVSPMIFTSPPYFDLEKYSGKSTQSYVRYPDYELWRDRFLNKVIEQSNQILQPGGHLILNVNDVDRAPIATDTVAFAHRWFDLQATYSLRLSLLPYNRSHLTNTYRYEPILVFAKRG